MDDTAFAQRLETLCRATLGGTGPLADLRRLSGGASMQSWRFAWGDELLILRRMPDGMRSDDTAIDSGALDLDGQADVIERAVEQGVMAPAVRARLVPGDGLGEGFIMACAPGEALPQVLLRDPAFADALSALPKQWAEQLAAIHSIAPATLPQALSYRSPADMVTDLETRWRELGGVSPIYALAFGWLERALPDPVEPRLCHGDFRMGNLLVTPEGLSAVLDWELAHLGDPVQDLAFGCIPSWRFGRYDKVLGGFGQPEDMLKHYAAITGAQVDPARFRFWLVYSCLWWGVCCLIMADIWRRGDQAGPERLVIGRRVSEVEIDLMLMLSDELAAVPAPMDWPDCDVPAETGVPGGAALADAVSLWIEGQVAANARGHARFEARVAMNALGMAARDAALGPRFRSSQEGRLGILGYDAPGLATAVRRDPASVTPAVHHHLRRLAAENCLIDQPRYAGLAMARSAWT
ncbi:aminoglycoside phosphotransferase (APT) family kinase protein [Blastomonas natatoria]|uniref:Aminoglycoside phosphotransferase (APT) family kinase protein n=1 Tax=Blastomonas natatoria TaxID=34015 RepID=A0A2V3UWY6_9SPHN|nr:phosphotransferase family protein [Blastomonas natatoria]PXW71631.1 aminoglycoside phosphotransferase (APT) family kinase protein [Blastomonas natatoria]